MALLDFLKKKAPPAVPGPAVPAPGMPPPPPPIGPPAGAPPPVPPAPGEPLAPEEGPAGALPPFAPLPTGLPAREIPPFGPPAPKGVGRVQVEEIAESIVEEKWKEFSEAHTKMNEWREHADSRLDKFEQSLADVKADLENLHKAIVAKIGEYDKNLLAVGTEIKAMEKVFQKVLPTLTENVSELSRITSRVRKPVKK